MSTAPLPDQNDDPSELDGDQESYVVSPERGGAFEVDVGSAQFSIADLVKKIERRQIELAPDYQRNEVWDVHRRSWFVESVILNIPLPPVYLNQRTDGTYVVIDGKQRLSTLRDFIGGRFELKGLPRCVALEGLRWEQLAPEIQARIEDRQISCHILKPSVPIELVYEIFHRINRGGVPLNRQEIRNGLFQGPATELLRQLAETIAVTGVAGSLSATRMKDQELALRCVAFRWRGLATYRGDMDGFLSEVMRELNRSTPEFRAGLATEFAMAAWWAVGAFGQDMFRIPTPGTRGRVNIALAECVYRFMCLHEVWKLDAADRIRENHAALVRDETFRNLCSWNTGDRKRLTERFERAEAMLSEGVC